MLYFYPDVSSSGIMYWPRSRRVITPVLREGMPELIREVSAERICFILNLQLRYSGLPVRRRLIRMMLTLQKYGEARSCPEQNAFTPAADLKVLFIRAVLALVLIAGDLLTAFDVQVS
ncbi:hypothetical protein [Cronobacter dublinensis]|uniref:hypothetical protein n=1 Tax=Cronobacter dublinensis TaxID=413497 RepID=UPI001DA2C561|nr:hypothetical protein [Cronobacter dublinensis subsp. dublinensis]ELY9424896.1 hypothetical protein [Cronobacter dublinensis]EGT5687980.1 hypothetical protein [Cronobacter dublinensis subsp. dublinensis]EGT5692015.1 hypothetical protein [Cronobacter dublinensis subsp. dublinensis]EGT5700599.1 hypothetical protein [Cronobacter dublinensis subsp. dublinensis]